MLPTKIKLPIEFETHLVGKDIKYIIDRSRPIPKFSYNSFVIAIIVALVLIPIWGYSIYRLNLGPDTCVLSVVNCTAEVRDDHKAITTVLFLYILVTIFAVPQHLLDYKFPHEFYVFTTTDLATFSRGKVKFYSWELLERYHFKDEKSDFSLRLDFHKAGSVIIPRVVDHLKVKELIEELKGQSNPTH